MSEQNSHGVDPTHEITAKDNNGAFAPPGAAHRQPGNDPTQGNRTLPIGGADGGQGDVYQPEGAFSHLIGQSNRETSDRYHNAYKGARDELAKGKPEPLKAADMKFNWSDRVKGQGGIAGDDAAVQMFAGIAEEHGFTQQQLDAIPKFFDTLVEKGLIEKPFDSATFLDSLAPEGFRGSPLDRQAKGSERLSAAEAWINQLDGKEFDAEMKNDLRLLTVSKGGIRAIERFMTAGMVESVAPGGGHNPAGITKEQLDARTTDPRNDSTRHDKFDPAFAEETRRLFREFYKENPQ